MSHFILYFFIQIAFFVSKMVNVPMPNKVYGSIIVRFFRAYMYMCDVCDEIFHIHSISQTVPILDLLIRCDMI